jgi:hypothetical protein
VLDRHLVERIAADLGTAPRPVEKDWHVVRALAIIVGVDPAGMMPAFSGGTSLSKAWGIIMCWSRRCRRPNEREIFPAPSDEGGRSG